LTQRIFQNSILEYCSGSIQQQRQWQELRVIATASLLLLTAAAAANRSPVITASRGRLLFLPL